jgi:hypothetical protein
MPTELIERSQTDLSTRSTDELRAQLAETLEITVANLLRMAAIVAELERRGVDLADLRLGLVGYLRQIAHGRLAARAVVRFAERPLLLRSVSSLPLPDQERLAEGERVQLAVHQEGAVTHRLVDPLDLSADQVRRVFGRDGLRTVEQQVPLLEERRAAPRKRAPRRGTVSADSERSGLRIGRSFAPLEEVLAALAELADADYDETAEGEAALVLKLSAAQHQQLKVRAARSRSSMTTLALRALAAYGLLRGEHTEETL